MKKLVTCEEMKNLDNATIHKIGVASEVLMERAALKVVEEMEKYLEKKEKILVVCGSGNNGGDGIAIARLFHLKGVRTEFFMAGNKEKMTRETVLQYKIATGYHVPEVNNPDWSEYTTIVDAVFGVGLARPIEGHYAKIIHEMNSARAKKIAVDIPSGVNGDTGLEMGIAFSADLTVTFAYAKRGLCFYPGRLYAGKIVIADIGIYEQEAVKASARCLEREDLTLFPERDPGGNKGTFGKILFVAGSEGMCGAAYLSASAALRAGAGMVKIQTVEENRIPLQILLPEAMVCTRFDEESNEQLLSWCDVIVIGPGLGTSGASREREQWFLTAAAREKKPLVLDADGLNLLAMHPQWREYIGDHVILTPHIGEMSRLCGKSIREIQENIAKTAVDYAREAGCVCVQKDACTVVTDGRNDVYLNISGNSGMATAGSGDVLSGILAGVLCMYLKTEEQPPMVLKAALGVYLHGLCGDLAAAEKGKRSMLAGDIIEYLPKALAIGEEESKL